MTAAICSCLSDAGPWAGRDEPGIPPSYTQTLRDGCKVHGSFRNRILQGDKVDSTGWTDGVMGPDVPSAAAPSILRQRLP